MKVGVLTMLKHEFIAFKKNNKAMECHHITSVNQLIAFTADMYIRVNGWQMLSVKVLNVVKAQEDLRDLNKSKVIEPLPKSQFNTLTGKSLTGRWPSGGIIQALSQSSKVVINGRHVGAIVKDDPFDSSLMQAWRDTDLFFPNLNSKTSQILPEDLNKETPMHPQVRCNMSAMEDAMKMATEAKRKAVIAFNEIRTTHSIRIQKEDLPFILNKDDIAGIP